MTAQTTPRATKLTFRERLDRRTVARTKRALERRLMRAGCPKKDAERIVGGMTQSERLKRLPLLTLIRISWGVGHG